MKFTIVLFLIGTLCVGTFGSKTVKVNDEPKPEQVHISLGTNETEMVITWSTVGRKTSKPVAQYWLGDTNLTEHSVAETTFFDNVKLYTYRALLTELKPGTVYYYQVGSEFQLSKIFKFRTLNSGSEWAPRLAIYGDLGYENEKSLPYLTKEVEKDDFDAIFHIGDFAYDLNERDGQQGNDFMNSIEPVASKVPYMTCPGNHEATANFTHYDARFSMIGDRNQPNHNAPLSHRLNNHYWSVDIGPAHIVLFSTEFYYYTEFGWDQIERQYRFLEEDLKRANANRAQRPWIIAMGHRPLYCLKTIWDDSCDYKAEDRPGIRTGIHMHDKPNTPAQYGLEDLFFKNGVDLQFYGHEHFYVRMLPLYNFKVMNGTNRNNPYDHPSGPLHMTTGSAGNRELHPAMNTLRDWVGFHKMDYGYTRLTFTNASHILLEQVSDDLGGAVIDKIDIIKHDPKPKWMP